MGKSDSYLQGIWVFTLRREGTNNKTPSLTVLGINFFFWGVRSPQRHVLDYASWEHTLCLQEGRGPCRLSVLFSDCLDGCTVHRFPLQRNNLPFLEGLVTAAARPWVGEASSILTKENPSGGPVVVFFT